MFSELGFITVLAQTKTKLCFPFSNHTAGFFTLPADCSKGIPVYSFPCVIPESNINVENFRTGLVFSLAFSEMSQQSADTGDLTLHKHALSFTGYL